MLFPLNNITTDSSTLEQQLSFTSVGDSNNHDLLLNRAMCTQTKSVATGDQHGSVERQQQQQQQQDATSNTTRNRWQTSSDIPDRLRLLANVRTIVVQKMLKSPGAVHMVHKLPTMSRKMEEILYRAANSRQEYLDLTTLEARLAMIARALETTGLPGVASRQRLGGRPLDIPASVAASSDAASVSSATSSSWQNPALDQQDRLALMTYIRQIVKKQILEKKEYPPQLLQKLPQVAKMMEVALYKSAPSKKDYLDLSTLHDRLQSITDELLDIRHHNRVSV